MNTNNLTSLQQGLIDGLIKEFTKINPKGEGVCSLASPLTAAPEPDGLFIMIDDPYKISAIPTSYNGREYRSRLEAKWAAFFDIIGWEYEYEPFDLPGWSPDFLLRPLCGAITGIEAILIEIKPSFMIDEKLKSRIISASKFSKYKALILNETPTKKDESTGYECFSELMQSYNGDKFIKCNIHSRVNDLAIMQIDNPEKNDKHWRYTDLDLIRSYWNIASNKVKFFKNGK